MLPAYRSVNQETPEHSGVPEYDEWSGDDLPNGSVGVPAGEETHATPVTHCRLVFVAAVAGDVGRQRLLHGLDILFCAFLITDSVFIFACVRLDWTSDGLWTDIRGLWDEKEDSEHEDTEQDGADAKGPSGNCQQPVFSPASSGSCDKVKLTCIRDPR